MRSLPCTFFCYERRSFGCYILTVQLGTREKMGKSTDDRRLEFDEDLCLQLYLADTNFEREQDDGELPCSYFRCCLSQEQRERAIKAPIDPAVD